MNLGILFITHLNIHHIIKKLTQGPPGGSLRTIPLNKDVHGRVARKNDLDTKLSASSMQKKTLSSLKPLDQCALE